MSNSLDVFKSEVKRSILKATATGDENAASLSCIFIVCLSLTSWFVSLFGWLVACVKCHLKMPCWLETETTSACRSKQLTSKNSLNCGNSTNAPQQPPNILRQKNPSELSRNSMACKSFDICRIFLCLLFNGTFEVVTWSRGLGGHFDLFRRN